MEIRIFISTTEGTKEATKDFLKEIMKEALAEYQEATQSLFKEKKIYSVNEVAKILQCSHSTVKKKIYSGAIRATIDNKITEEELKRYLNELTK
ncbi:MAG: helix-turn-helix domain-containing protein [Bacteroidetes bacterium]|jgi:DNA-directed RNA polymerase specialized sigma24 family protein|nr:helix-turn-helix domain-containing protein [Bacteroidota bacterium]MBT5989405.1 helix-turn-helix domain-containing protein [Bacteroidota bacterium]MBT6836477.1 helix-turn-helix domain-containing protein [Bacteroidota bacterium]